MNISTCISVTVLGMFNVTSDEQPLSRPVFITLNPVGNANVDSFLQPLNASSPMSSSPSIPSENFISVIFLLFVNAPAKIRSIVFGMSTMPSTPLAPTGQ